MEARNQRHAQAASVAARGDRAVVVVIAATRALAASRFYHHWLQADDGNALDANGTATN
jgi:hypothetical protein